MKKSFSLILASLLLAVSFASCGDTAGIVKICAVRNPPKSEFQ